MMSIFCIRTSNDPNIDHNKEPCEGETCEIDYESNGAPNPLACTTCSLPIVWIPESLNLIEVEDENI